MCSNDTLVSSYGCFASWLKYMCLRIRITLYVVQKIFGYRIPCVQVTTWLRQARGNRACDVPSSFAKCKWGGGVNIKFIPLSCHLSHHRIFSDNTQVLLQALLFLN